MTQTWRGRWPPASASTTMGPRARAAAAGPGAGGWVQIKKPVADPAGPRPCFQLLVMRLCCTAGQGPPSSAGAGPGWRSQLAPTGVARSLACKPTCTLLCMLCLLRCRPSGPPTAQHDEDADLAAAIAASIAEHEKQQSQQAGGGSDAAGAAGSSSVSAAELAAALDAAAQQHGAHGAAAGAAGQQQPAGPAGPALPELGEAPLSLSATPPCAVPDIAERSPLIRSQARSALYTPSLHLSLPSSPALQARSQRLAARV